MVKNKTVEDVLVSLAGRDLEKQKREHRPVFVLIIPSLLTSE